MSSPTNSTTRTAAPAGPILKAGAIAGAVAGVLNVIVFLIGKAAGVPFVVNQPSKGTSVIFAQPLFASFLVVFVGSVVLWLLTRVSNGVNIWSGAAIVFVVLYSLVAFGAAAATSTAVTLTVMHFVALAVALVMLRPAAAKA